ncbi:MAG: hypothetical protein QOD75_3404, partial [Blastocatellia bacterium]|nr:hypothetical protein [Blastocatellia bacterium]
AFGTQSEGFLRVSFCAAEAKLSEGIARMEQALHAFEKTK